MTMNINMRKVVMERDRVPGLGMVEYLMQGQLLLRVWDIQKKESLQALPSHGGEGNQMDLFKCSLKRVYYSRIKLFHQWGLIQVGGPVWQKKGKGVQSEEWNSWRALLL